jgi:hypothetical protein
MQAILSFYLPYVPHKKSRKGSFLAIFTFLLLLAMFSFSPLLVKEHWRGWIIGVWIMVALLQTVWCGVIYAQTQTHGNGERYLRSPVLAYWSAGAVVVVIAFMTLVVSAMITGVLRLQT